jgi:hypothetical protein
MRVSGILLLVVLIAAAVVLFLRGVETQESLRAVSDVANYLREEGVKGRALDRGAAEQAIEALQQLVDNPASVSAHADDLREIASTAAGWADAAPAPSQELRIAVSIRSAAGELRSYSIRPRDPHLVTAQRKLDEARAAFADDAPAGGAAGAVRDRLENLQRSQQERIQTYQDQIDQ